MDVAIQKTLSIILIDGLANTLAQHTSASEYFGNRREQVCEFALDNPRFQSAIQKGTVVLEEIKTVITRETGGELCAFLSLPGLMAIVQKIYADRLAAQKNSALPAIKLEMGHLAKLHLGASSARLADQLYSILLVGCDATLSAAVESEFGSFGRR